MRLNALILGGIPLFRFKPLLFSLLILFTGLFLTACGNKQTQVQPSHKLALVKSGQSSKPRVWYHFAQSHTQVTNKDAVSALFVLRNGQATTYMLPTRKHRVTLSDLAQMSTAEQIKWAKKQDRTAFRSGVAAQQNRVADTITGIKADLKRLQKSKSDPSQIKALQQYLKINEAIHNNPSKYTKPVSYPLTATEQAHGEQFGLKLYPVKTVQYGDANIITANELPLTNYSFNKRIQPRRIGYHYYGGYRSTVNANHYLILTRVTKHTRIIYDHQKTAGVSKPVSAE